MKSFLGVLIAVSSLSTMAEAAPRRDAMIPMFVDPATIAPQVDTNILFLNRCANGCPVNCTRGTTGQTDSTTDKSSVCGGGVKTLTKFKAGDAVWNDVVRCVKEVFAPFNVQVTDVDPGTAKHFEIMIAGKDSDLGLSGLGGVSPFSCSGAYIPNALVFDFADTYGSDVDELCAVAAQEIAHAFTLDHVTEASDPLTYFPYTGRRHFKDAGVRCGSDCTNGRSPFGDSCSGANLQEHACACTRSATQNSVATLTALFGTGTLVPPTVQITRPKNGANVEPGFPVNTNVTDDIGIQKVELRVDDQMIATLETGPYAFNAPTMLGDGTHRIEVIAYDVTGAKSNAVASVYIGTPCTKPADCPTDTDTCVGGRCVPGTGVQGGLGSTCAANGDCASGLCVAAEGADSICGETCDPATTGQCPSGFECLEYGSSGVCYPGGGDGGGCASGGGELSMLVGLGLAATLLRRKRA